LQYVFLKKDSDEDYVKQNMLKVPQINKKTDNENDKIFPDIPMEKKKDGTLSAARSKAVPSQKMRDLCAFAARKSEDLAARIVQGEIRALPCRRKNFIVCDWCSLKEACSWDRHIPGCTSLQIREFPNEDAIWEIIGQQTSKE
jgi:ATP-dependent helicase/DNAse subunit B